MYAGVVAKEDIIKQQLEENNIIKDELYNIYKIIGENYERYLDICNRYNISDEDRKEIFDSFKDFDMIMKDFDENDLY